MNNIIILIRKINNVILTSKRGRAVTRIIKNCESRVTQSEEIHKIKVSEEITPSDNIF